MRMIYIILLINSTIFANLIGNNSYIKNIKFYSGTKIIKSRKVHKIIKEHGVKYFNNLNSNLIKAIKNNNLANIKKYIKKGAHVRTGIYYAAIENKVDILKLLFEYDKIDFNNEVYFLKVKYLDDHFIRLVRPSFMDDFGEIFFSYNFCIYGYYSYKLSSLLHNILLIKYETLKFILKNSYNKDLISLDLISNIFDRISLIKDIRKFDLLVKEFNIDIFEDDHIEQSLLSKVVGGKSNNLIKHVLRNYINKSNVNTILNQGLSIYTPLYEYKNSAHKRDGAGIDKGIIKLFEEKGAIGSHNKTIELYKSILLGKKEIVEKLLKEGLSPTSALSIYLDYGKNCKITASNGSCILKDENCSNLKKFIKFKINYDKLFPYSSCKNNEKYKIFNKIKNIGKKIGGQTALRYSLFDNDFEQSEYLLKRGADPNQIMVTYYSYLYIYTVLDSILSIGRNKNDKFVKLLLKYKAKRVCEIFKVNCVNGLIMNKYNYLTYDKGKIDVKPSGDK